MHTLLVPPFFGYKIRNALNDGITGGLAEVEKSLSVHENQASHY
jgi:hypothetical protein